ncbi:MAG: hypothetical protein J0H75_04150 [Rhizobiales bacterium]|nr:hypothetical protein [Hyphomicrobiales bacterium]
MRTLSDGNGFPADGLAADDLAVDDLTVDLGISVTHEVARYRGDLHSMLWLRNPPRRAARTHSPPRETTSNQNAPRLPCVPDKTTMMFVALSGPAKIV